MYKGSQCSVNGKNYEKMVYDIVKTCYINHIPFNTQKVSELGGCSSKNDINCNLNGIEDIGIEVKKYNAPDWMQCSIKYVDGEWIPSKGRTANETCMIFYNLIKDKNLYDGEIPPFINNEITHEQWTNVKKETNKWNDIYIDIPSDTISKLYRIKGCDYIQISNYWLYHLGNDICGFYVPLFEVEQQLRIRTKIHTRKNKKGFCKLSVMVACQPKNIKNLKPSNYSLDSYEKLPGNLNLE